MSIVLAFNLVLGFNLVTCIFVSNIPFIYCHQFDGADCSFIQEGQACYEANNLVELASYAYNDHY